MHFSDSYNSNVTMLLGLCMAVKLLSTYQSNSVLHSDICRWRPSPSSGKTILRTKNTAYRPSVLPCAHTLFRGPFDTELVYVTLPTYVYVFLNCYMCIVLDHFADNTSVMLGTFCETSPSFGCYPFFVLEKTLHQISARRATVLTVFFPRFLQYFQAAARI
jgi:hypothetical protein